jgi:hypothetical protein
MNILRRLAVQLKLTQVRVNPVGKVYISGTGRAGTTMLIQLLTELGLDTGFKDADPTKHYFELARAGYEWDLSDIGGPRFQKSPYLCDRLDEIVSRGVKIDYLIVPVRDTADAAQSRIKVQIATSGHADGEEVAGGLWSTTQAAQQESILNAKLSSLIEVAVRYDISLIFLAYPRHVLDAEYAYEKLAPVLGEIGLTTFKAAFRKVSKPELISKFA